MGGTRAARTYPVKPMACWTLRRVSAFGTLDHREDLRCHQVVPSGADSIGSLMFIPMADPWCCYTGYIWCAMDPIKKNPPLC